MVEFTQKLTVINGTTTICREPFVSVLTGIAVMNNYKKALKFTENGYTSGQFKKIEV